MFMRKLTPYDELACFCKIKPILKINGTGVSMTGGQNCQCIAYPAKRAIFSLPHLRTRAGVDAFMKARDLKITKFKVFAVVPDIPEIIRGP